MGSQETDSPPDLDSRGLPWYQWVKFGFVRYNGFSKLDNDVLHEVMKTLEKVEKEPLAASALTLAFIEKYLDILVRSYAQKSGKRLHDILTQHPGSPYHKFRKASHAEKLISDEFNDWARQISDMRDAMIHLDLEELATTGDRTSRSIRSLFKQMAKKMPPGQKSRVIKPSPDILDRPLSKIPEAERLEAVMEGNEMVCSQN